MKTNNLYRTEIKAARRLAEWIDEHPAATNIFIATAGILCALYVFFNY